MINRHLSSILLCLLLLFNIGLYANSSKRRAQAVRVSESPLIDGSLDEDLWRGLPVFTDFIQYSPYNGKQPSQRTEVRIGYDDRAIYIGAFCYDGSPEKIKQEISIRDQLPQGMNVDGFAILINPYNDGLNSVFLMVTAAGVQRDVKIYGDEHEITWDAVWESSVKVTQRGWVVEMKIPLSVLRFPTKPVQHWGLNLWRWIARTREWAHWNFVDINYPGWWKKMGEWNGIKNLRTSLRLSFTPYISGYMEFETAQKSDFLYHGGVDLKYGITDSFTLDSTLIPDFGQVQSDDIELNLSPYEIKYNEKRQFFTEGMELFNKGDLFYSRRIGDTPINYNSVVEGTHEDEELLNNPQQARLINATKISGRTNFGLGIGILNAMTARTYATVFNRKTGEERKILTQPFSNYNMLILDQTLFTHSFVSLANTNVSRKGHSANVTALDLKLVDKTNTYGLSGIFGYSQVESNETRVDGYKLDFSGGKFGGNLQAHYHLSAITDDYSQNDLGYLRRNNEVINQISLSHQTSKPFACFLRISNQFQLIYSSVFDSGAFSEFLYAYQISASFKNHYQFSMRFEHAPADRNDYYEPRIKGRYFINYKYLKYGISGQTDPRRPIWIEASCDFLNSYDYGFDVRSTWIHITPRFTINDHLNLIWQFSFEGNKNDLGYVDQELDSQKIYFGKRDRQTVANTLEVSYVFNHKISLAFRLRHYHSKAEYDSYYHLNQDGTMSMSGYPENHDINYNVFNIDSILRWNFAPGSEILLNWKNAIYTTDQLTNTSYWRNFATVLDAPHVNSISLKIIYYFDL